MIGITLFSLSLNSLSLAQISFQRTFGGASTDIGRAVVPMADGGYIFAGYTLSFGVGSRDVYLIRTDSSGSEIWSRTFGGSNIDYAWTVDLTSDGGCVVGAHSGSFGAGSHDIYLIRCDAAGDTVWTRLYGGSSADGAYSLRQTSDGGTIVAAHTSSFGAGQHDVYLLKLDSDGDTAWTRSYGGPGGDFLRSVYQTADGGYVAVAETFSFGQGGADIYLVRTDSTGDLKWAATYGGPSSDYAYAVQETSDKGIIMAGYTSSFGAGSFDVYLLKTDSLGVLLWANTYGGPSQDYGYSVSETMDGGFVIAGYTLSFGAGGDVYLVRTDRDGNLLWSRTYGGTAGDYGWSVRETSDSGFVIGGYTASFGAGLTDFYLIKTDRLGISGCHEAPANTIVGATLTIRDTTQTTVSGGAIRSNSATIVQDPPTVESLLTCAPCDCSCHGNPVCQDMINMQDVVSCINVAFHDGSPVPDPNPACPRVTTDVDCDNRTDVFDVVHLVAVAFRNEDPALHFCDPCEP